MKILFLFGFYFTFLLLTSCQEYYNTETIQNDNTYLNNNTNNDKCNCHCHCYAPEPEHHRSHHWPHHREGSIVLK